MAHAAALLGVDGVGRKHGRHLAANPEVDLVALADTDPDALAAAGDRWGVPADRRYADAEAMVGAEDVDLLSVATPTPFHRDHVVAAARSPAAPDAVWCEKPIAESVADGAAMVEACEAAGVDLVVNHSRRFLDEWAALHEVVDRLGEVVSVTATWPRELLRNGTHLVDLVLPLLDGAPTAVSGHLTGERGLTADRPLDDCGAGGVLVTDADEFVTLDATLPRAASAWTLHVVGREGRTRVDLRTGEWRVWDLADGDHVERDHPATAGGWRPAEEDYFGNAVAGLVATLDGAANPSPGTEALDALEVLVGLAVSSATASRVALPLDPPLRDARVRSW